MKKSFKSILLILPLVVLILIIYGNRYNIEFKYHVFGYDEKLYDKDFLHPSYVYLKNNKIIGLEKTSNPECGQTNLKYFFDQKESLNKIIYQIDFFSSHCNENYDSLYIIKREKSEISIYDKNGNQIVQKGGLKKLFSTFSTTDLKKEILTWKK